MNSINQRNMRKGDVRNGKKFIHKETLKSEEFEVVKEYGNIFLKNKKKVYAGRVKNIDNEGFDVSIFLFAIEVSVRVNFKNCLVTY